MKKKMVHKENYTWTQIIFLKDFVGLDVNFTVC